jgi:arsenate reductase
MEKTRILFVCIHNSARSQMAEAWLNHLFGDRFEGRSAGLEPGVLNPLAVAVMKEAGIDISANETKSVNDLLAAGERFSRVVAVCDPEAAEKCPVFPGAGEPLHWSFPDPSGVAGTEQEKLGKVRVVRDSIRKAIEQHFGPEN